MVIVEAGEQSGALITANFASEQGRDVFAVPGNIFNPGSIGSNELIRQGAIPLLSPNDILEHLNIPQFTAQHTARQSVPTDPLEAQLLTYLSSEPRHIDEIVRSTAMPTPQVSSLLTVMELKGLVRQAAPFCYVRF